MKFPFKNDVAVLFLFFNREEQTKKVFEGIKKGRPSKLFLYQDGPRENRPDDIDHIKKCREIVSDIDWDCEIYTHFCQKNQGCDPSEYLSQKWMFSIVDKGIVLEDDDIPSESFFPFCKELLDRYENDNRINMICGQNILETYDCGGADYFFTQSGAIWGWATWKRVIDEWDPQYKFLGDKYAENLIECFYGSKKLAKQFIDTCKWHKLSGKEYYESILISNTILKGRFNIVPSKNMISNCGLSNEATHNTSKLEYFPRKFRRVFYMKTYEYEFPLKHPKYIANDRRFMELVRDMLTGNKYERFFHLRGIEARLNRYVPFFAKL